MEEINKAGVPMTEEIPAKGKEVPMNAKNATIVLSEYLEPLKLTGREHANIQSALHYLMITATKQEEKESPK